MNKKDKMQPSKYNVKVDDRLKNLVTKEQGDKLFQYEEDVKDFTGLIFHCPDCNAEFHLHIAQITLVTKLIDKAKKYVKNRRLKVKEED